MRDGPATVEPPPGTRKPLRIGLGIVLISFIGCVSFVRRSIPAMVGIGLIVAGVAAANVFSKSIVH